MANKPQRSKRFRPKSKKGRMTWSHDQHAPHPDRANIIVRRTFEKKFQRRLELQERRDA